MRPLRRAMLAVFLLSLVLVGSAAAYTVLTGSTTARVNEPLSVSGVSAKDPSSGVSGTCSQYSCSLAMYAGESGQVTFTLHNAASVSIAATVVASSNDSSNVPVTVSGLPSHGGIPAASSVTVTLGFTASQSMPPGTVLITWSVSR